MSSSLFLAHQSILLYILTPTQYDGEWRNGLMHGFGTFLWTSGQRYDGEWKDGRRDGIGVKVYADGELGETNGRLLVTLVDQDMEYVSFH